MLAEEQGVLEVVPLEGITLCAPDFLRFCHSMEVLALTSVDHESPAEINGPLEVERMFLGNHRSRFLALISNHSCGASLKIGFIGLPWFLCR